MINLQERRKFVRYPIYCPMQYKCDDALPKDSCITINISESGAMISSRNPLDLSGNIILRVYLRNKEFFIKARVVHVQEEREGGPYNVGVEFLDRPAGFTSGFYDELEGIMLYQRQYSEEAGREMSLAEASIKWYRNSPIPL